MTEESQTRKPAWADLESVPEGFVCENLGGELVLRPSPDPPHGRVQSNLHALLVGRSGLE